MESIIENITITTVAISAITYLFKSLVTNLLSKDLENFKLDIQREADRKFEQYKSELESERIRLNISYNEIFARQAEVIVNLYKYLNKLEESLVFLLRMLNSENDNHNVVKAVESWHKFSDYFSENKILLTEGMVNELEYLEKTVFFEHLKYRKILKNNSANIDAKVIREAEKVVEQLPILKKSLEQKFRVMIGTNSP
ncbi:hypothetical protein [Vibrio paracholerae]|uniref:hypothetical protein n=1 Tax=Vibrio paracholerae TaxID=650003 RepID=UPI000DE38E21|nr:hypothetical protein [Vibrio paracholerae]RBM88905.1 hypothetical protein DLR74_07730 [Vibrio paracholerae]